MEVGYPSVWRFFADALIDVRMPLFAFIAGVVYALRPLVLADAFRFFIGKFHRIFVPGVVASVFFWLVCNLIFSSGFAYGANPVATVLLSTGHFWFLQAILLIFLIVGVLDAALKYRFTTFLFLGALALTLVWKLLPIPDVRYLKINSAVYLAPYFLLGLLLFRYHEAIMARQRIIIVVATCLFCLGVLLNIGVYQETGQLSRNRFDLQSLALGIGIILLTQFMFPKIGLFDRLAAYSFTIYLYHPVGTGAVRRVIEVLDINSTALHFTIGVTAGFVLPCLIHTMADRFDWSRRMLLGLRPKNAALLT